MNIRDFEHDIVGQTLNFISCNDKYALRRHYRQGLRSLVVEFLSRDDLEIEKKGVENDGLKEFPRAIPSHVLRIYKKNITKEQALEEARKVKLLNKYLKENVAYSMEFIVDYYINGRHEPLLCGLQEYINDFSYPPIDPWHCVPEAYPDGFKEEVGQFVDRVKEIANSEGLMPDLAGKANLLYAQRGVVLIDVNNVNYFDYSDNIFLDDNGFPVIDNSVEALSRLDELANGYLAQERLYSHFLNFYRLNKTRDVIRSWLHKEYGHVPRAD